MMSPLDVVAVVAALVVFVGRWEKLQQRRLVLPGIAIGVTGGGLNAYAVAVVSGRPVALGMILLEAGIFSVMAISGLHLAEEAGLPGLWRTRGLRVRAASVGAGIVLVGSIGVVQRLVLNFLGRVEARRRESFRFGAILALSPHLVHWYNEPSGGMGHGERPTTAIERLVPAFRCCACVSFWLASRQGCRGTAW